MPGYWDLVRQDPGLPNLGQIFMQAQEARQRSQMHELQLADYKQRQEQATTEAERQKLLPEAIQSAEAGRPQMLQQIAPDVYQKWVTERETKQKAEAHRIANVQRFVAQGLQSGSIKPEQAQAMLKAQGAALSPTGRPITQGLGDFAAPVDANPEALQGQASAVLGAPSPDKQPFDAVTQAVVAKTNLRPGQPGFSEAYASEERYQHLLKEKQAKAGATTVNNVMPGAGLEKPVRAKAEQTIIDASTALDKLNSTLSAAKPDLFSYRSQLTGWAAPKLEKAGVPISASTQDELALRTTLVQQLEQLFNAYRVEVTGAAAPMAELEQLRASFLNKDLSWTQFRASAENYKRDIARKLRISRKVLSQGLDLAPDQRDTVISDMLQQGEQGNSPTDRLSRMQQLKAQGLTPEQVKKRLVVEGYIDG